MKPDYVRYTKLAIVLILIIGAIVYLELQKSPPSKIIESTSNNQNAMINSKDDIKIENNKSMENNEIPKERIRNPAKEGLYEFAPDFSGIYNWINSEPLKMVDLQGKVVLIDFWTYSCVNCKRTLPYINAWYDKYHDEGLVIVGVHTPEFLFEYKTENVKTAIEKYDIKYPVAQDNDRGTWNAYNNRYWPRKYLIDKDGYIRYDHIGEGGYNETEMEIQKLLSETGAKVDEELVNITEETPTTRNTPELYVGYDYALRRNQNIGNEEGLQPDKEIKYNLPENLEYDKIYVEGTWKSNSDNLEAMSDGAIVINYVSKSVNIVATSKESSIMKVLVDNDFLNQSSQGDDVKIVDGESVVSIDEPRLYNIYNGEYDRKTLRLEVEKGFSFNAFTFG